MDETSTANATENIELPDTVTTLDAPMGGKVYVIGTAHFSEKSQQEVIEVRVFVVIYATGFSLMFFFSNKLIRKVRPNCVMLELCPSRSKILSLDEETILRESKDMSFNKMLELMKSVCLPCLNLLGRSRANKLALFFKTSAIKGVLHILLIRLYAKVTAELGMAPGGEFRVAYRQVFRPFKSDLSVFVQHISN